MHEQFIKIKCNNCHELNKISNYFLINSRSNCTNFKYELFETES